MSEQLAPWQGLVLAGERPGGDPLARALGVHRKALIEIAGRTMLEHVVTNLRRSGVTDRIAVSGVDQQDLALHPALGRVDVLAAGPTPSASVLAALDHGEPGPLLVTTADHPLLRPKTIAAFATAASRGTADVAVGVVDEALIRARFPASQRTFVRFRRRGLSGANLYAFSTPAARRAAAAWREIEGERKRPWRMVRKLGPLTLLRFVLRRLPLDDAIARASERLGARVELVWLDDPHAAVDVDRVADLALVAQLLEMDPEGK